MGKEKRESQIRKEKGEKQMGTEALVALTELEVTESEVERLGEAIMGAEEQ